jgi:predicted GIY-YIG superfamily endonuclease
LTRRSLARRLVSEGGLFILQRHRSELRLGMPFRDEKFYNVYVLQSEADSRRFYTGCTQDLCKRLVRHNNGEVPHTSKWKPWRIKTYIAFSDRVQSKAFERYLKSVSGRAFLKKRL